MIIAGKRLKCVFVRETKITPADFIESARFDAARPLLEATCDPLKRVAYRCGFSNANQMWQVFVKRLGVTAMQYRANFAGFQKPKVLRAQIFQYRSFPLLAFCCA